MLGPFFCGGVLVDADGDDDDLEVIKTGVSRLEVNETGDRYEVEEVLKNVSGDTIGAVGVVFPYKKGQDTAREQAIAKEAGATVMAGVMSPTASAPASEAGGGRSGLPSAGSAALAASR